MWQKVTTVIPLSPDSPSPARGGGSGERAPPFYFSIGAPIRLPHSVHEPS
jgi:hypothetical protein